MATIELLERMDQAFESYHNYWQRVFARFFNAVQRYLNGVSQ